MSYQPKKFDQLIGINGLSENLLKNHFTLYEGYVNNTNKLFEETDALWEQGKLGTPQSNELKRRLGWEFNGMRLHELYFENLSKQSKELAENSSLRKKLIAGYGSFEDWLEDFKATLAMRGIGWVILYCDPQTGYLINSWINEHDTGHLTGAVPLLVIDVFEHAYLTDYGIKRADYIEAIIKLIDWEVVEKRFVTAIK